MPTWCRRLRGIATTGMLWGFAGATLGTVLGGLNALLFGGAPFEFVRMAADMGVLGAAMGSGFASALAAFERHKALDELSVGRSALWGALGGAVAPTIFLVMLYVRYLPAGIEWSMFPGDFMTTLPMLPWTGALGCAVAAATMLVARKTAGELQP